MIDRTAIAKRRRLGLRQCRRWGYGQEWITPAAIGRAGTTRCPCSSYCCGNPRKWFGEKTMQERRAELDVLDDE